mmetsp:Transcript_11673/g.21029  ORF Transcript_11673/g.21029 Transcript_11673/m.21029 type:complete len:284 (+) Transcript_11673:1321-2172(+)
MRNANLGEGGQRKLGGVGVGEVPDVAVLAHPLRLLLKLEDGVGNDRLAEAGVGVPIDVGDVARDGVGVTKHGDGLCAGGLIAVVRHHPSPVLLIYVNRVVLFYEFLDGGAKRDDGVDVLLILLDLLAVADDVLRLREVHLLGPPPLVVAYHLVCVYNGCRVRLVLAHFRHHLRDAGHRVARGVLIRVLLVGTDVCQHLGTLVHKLRVPAKRPAGLGVAMIHLHGGPLLLPQDRHNDPRTARIINDDPRSVDGLVDWRRRLSNAPSRSSTYLQSLDGLHHNCPF